MGVWKLEWLNVNEIPFGKLIELSNKKHVWRCTDCYKKYSSCVWITICDDCCQKRTEAIVTHG